MHRVFIAINLPEDIKEELVRYQDRHFDLEAAQWTKKENLHITLEFIGNASDEDLEDIFKKTEELAKKMPLFEISLNKISYFPDNRMPRYIFATDGRYHVTLARIRQWEWRKISPEERPDIKEELNLSFKPKSIEVMESFLKREGPEYRVLKSYSLI